MRAVALLGDAAAEGANAETPGAKAAAAANRAREDAESFIGLVMYFRRMDLELIVWLVADNNGRNPEGASAPIFEEAVEGGRSILQSARVRDDGQTNAAIFLAIARKARGCASWFSSFKSSFLSTGAICYLLQGVSVPLKSRIVAPYIFHSTASISSL